MALSLFVFEQLGSRKHLHIVFPDPPCFANSLAYGHGLRFRETGLLKIHWAVQYVCFTIVISGFRLPAIKIANCAVKRVLLIL